MTSVHDAAGMAEFRKQARLDPAQLRQLRNGFYKKQLTEREVLDALPEKQRPIVASGVSFHSLKLVSRHDSRVDGASKLLFRTAAGHILETVILRIASGRTSLCVSSQIGCAARCEFCATGHMAQAVNLSCTEILDQLIQANQMLRAEGRSVRNVVFMGMGEPLHNEAEVFAAIEVLLSADCFNIPPGRVVLSTVGIPQAMVRCAERFPRLGLALSLHSARQSQRERLIPLARRYPLDMLKDALLNVTNRQHKTVMIEYLLLDGINDTDEDLEALAEYLQDLPVHINLIPYNPIADAPNLSSTPPARRKEFAAALTAAGFTVTTRYSLGSDIAAACGQLARVGLTLRVRNSSPGA
jgi:23S rRNA (adenine2503-C2)-methyltransferase